MTSSEKQPLLTTTSTTASTSASAAIKSTAASTSAAVTTTASTTTAKTSHTNTTKSSISPLTSTTSAKSAAGAGAGKDGAGGAKKKQPPFLEREVKVQNPDSIDHKSLLINLHGRFKKSFVRWKRRSGFFKLANLIVTLVIVAVQIAQVVVFQLTVIPTVTKTAIATILPTITGAVLAIQLKLGWGEKAIKCKKSARLYNKLATHAEYRMAIVEAGGELSDSVKVWNTALISETTEVPAFLSAY